MRILAIIPHCGDGQFESSSENKVTAVKVSLMNSDGTLAKLYDISGGNYLSNNNGTLTFTTQAATVDVSSDGTYSFAGVVPGEYYLMFTYSDGTKIIKNSGETEEIDLISYKSTILDETVYNSSAGKLWYLNVMGSTDEYSVATDKTYIASDGSTTKDIISMRTGNTDEIYYNSITEFNKGQIEAVSEVMNIKFEYLESDKEKYNYDFEANCSGMNFGIIERPHTDITLEKTITNVKITLSNGTTIINENPNEQIVSAYLAKLGEDGSYAKVEMDTSSLYGATAIVTYKLTVTNESELDYATADFYKYGKIDSTQVVTTTVTKIIDYLSNENCDYQSEYYNIQGLVEDWRNVDYFSTYSGENVYYQNKSQYETCLIEIDTGDKSNALYPTGYENNSIDYTLSVSKLLSASDEDMGWSSYSEIIGITNLTLSAQSYSTSGSYVIEDAQTSENDDSYSVIAITPATGENRSYTKYVIIGAILIILATGIIVAKKKVI